MTACSALFFDYYLDLLDSLDSLGLQNNFDIGLLDLGLRADQLAQLEARKVKRVVKRVAATWPVQAPPFQDRIEYIAFAAKPYAPQYFPGYELYVWMDADLWAQTPAFWPHLIDGAMRDGVAIPLERDINYRRMPARSRLWMWRHFARTYGLVRAVQLMRNPVLNNGLFAARADAPHWFLWQKHFELMVLKTRRLVAIDQLALISMIHIEKQAWAILPATDNWVCSLATPWWDPKQSVFVRPGEPDKPVSVMHLTTPSRDRMFDVHLPDGQTERRYLYRPGGHVMTAMKHASSGQPGATVAEPSIGAKRTHSRLARTVSR